VAFVLPGALVAELDAIAAQEKRSRAKMFEFILEDWLRSHRGQRAA
jgi:hypothetical protein